MKRAFIPEPRTCRRRAWTESTLRMNRRKRKTDAASCPWVQASRGPSDRIRRRSETARGRGFLRQPGASGSCTRDGRSAGVCPRRRRDRGTLAGELLPAAGDSAALRRNQRFILTPDRRSAAGPQPGSPRPTAATWCPNARKPPRGSPGFIRRSLDSRLEQAPAQRLVQGLVPAGNSELAVEPPELGLDRVHRNKMHACYLRE